jgi:hypothetical protein
MNHQTPIKSFADLRTIVAARDAEKVAAAFTQGPTLADKLARFKTLHKESEALVRLSLGREPNFGHLILGVGNTDVYRSLLESNASNLSSVATKRIDLYIDRLEKKIEHLTQGGDLLKFRIQHRAARFAPAPVQPIEAARIVRNDVMTALNAEMASAIRNGTFAAFWQQEKPAALADLAKALLAVYGEMDGGDSVYTTPAKTVV